MFEILVNGIPRTYRDQEGMALDAGRVLKDRDRTSEITVINDDTRQWVISRRRHRSGLAAKMANSIDRSNTLHKTYAPVSIEIVRDVDDARRRGRRKMRDQNE